MKKVQIITGILLGPGGLAVHFHFFFFLCAAFAVFAARNYLANAYYRGGTGECCLPEGGHNH